MGGVFVFLGQKSRISIVHFPVQVSRALKSIKLTILHIFFLFSGEGPPVFPGGIPTRRRLTSWLLSEEENKCQLYQVPPRPGGSSKPPFSYPGYAYEKNHLEISEGRPPACGELQVAEVFYKVRVAMFIAFIVANCESAKRTGPAG